MKKALLAASALASAVMMAPVANAADVAPAGYDWTGIYFGVNAGAAWNNSEVHNDFDYTGADITNGLTAAEINTYLDDLGDNINGDEAAFTGGAMLGYNWQMDSLVLGAEADINYVGFSDDNSRDVSALMNDLLEETTINAKSETSFDANWFGTLRGRIGFAADNMLFYGTGGLAYGYMEASADLKASDSRDSSYAGSYHGSTDATNWGWTAGAGVEYGIDNWSLGVEYLYVDLGSAEWDGDILETADSADSDLLADIKGDGSVDYQFSVVRATAKLRF